MSFFLKRKNFNHTLFSHSSEHEFDRLHESLQSDRVNCVYVSASLVELLSSLSIIHEQKNPSA